MRWRQRYFWCSAAFCACRPSRTRRLTGRLNSSFNTFLFIVFGALVMWMCAGFTMLESGSVRTKNASMICLKNIGLYSIAGLAYYFIGYNLMYVGVGGLWRLDRLIQAPLRTVGR